MSHAPPVAFSPSKQVSGRLCRTTRWSPSLVRDAPFPPTPPIPDASKRSRSPSLAVEWLRDTRIPARHRSHAIAQAPTDAWFQEHIILLKGPRGEAVCRVGAWILRSADLYCDDVVGARRKKEEHAPYEIGAHLQFRQGQWRGESGVLQNGAIRGYAVCGRSPRGLRLALACHNSERPEISVLQYSIGQPKMLTPNRMMHSSMLSTSC